ncbi:MAG TPA: calcium-binding protein [Conexibacter sp.]|nr:calcium-binding protein [Conexibacter sp.]
MLVLAFAASPAWAGVNACNEPPPPGYNSITGRSGTIEGTPGNDYIVGSAGADTITAGYGNDIVCAGDGDDVVYGGGKGDDLHGGNGRDKLFGQLLDDELYGGPERDVLIGGHGTDEMFGQEGNDWLRGGTNVDHYDGGNNPAEAPIDRDNDVASFADATPTGGHVTGYNGVVVNLTSTADPVTGQPPHTAKGGGEDTLADIESVVGSPFDDRVYADTTEPFRVLYGGQGSDSCSGGCEEPTTSLTAPYAYIDSFNPIAIEPILPDPMLIVVGGSAGETFTLSNSSIAFTVTAAAGGSAVTLNTYRSSAETPCSVVTRGTVRCEFDVDRTGDPARAPAAGGQTWFGAAGADTMTDRTAAPNGMTTDLDGGDDSDTITGSAGSETLVSGQSGSDVLHGGAEGDALLALGTGGDQLFGEEGNDQLATGEPCEGHVYRGGPDQDVAGFARTTGSGVTASLGDPNGNPATVGSSWYGAAYRAREDGSNRCEGATRTWVGADNEILEGTNQNDFLTGNQNDNTLWLREGVDRAHAGAGNDIVEGNSGADTVFGEAGRDVITGGPGSDRLHGEEGEDDIEGQTEPDELWGEEGNDRLFGGDHGDHLFGGLANDLVDGGAGVDELFGQEGNDRLRARDGTADSVVNCGPDSDEPVEADPFDPIANC